jgi:hypothetical protein
MAAGGDKSLYAGFWSKPWSMASILDPGPHEPLVDRIYQNFPNPFLTKTTIAYTVGKQTEIEIAIFDVRGRRVRTLVSRRASPGRYTTAFDGTDDRGERVSPGVYFYRLTTGEQRSVKKMIILE